jgi:DNA modification methylase
MVEVFREVRRVLRDDGTLWLNMGDSYASSTGQKTITPQTAYKTGRAGGDPFAPPKKTLDYEECDAGLKDYGCLKPKDLIGIPWRVAFALQADGWYLRSDIIWHKPNPLPESVRDRPTRSHEYIFLMCKSAKYWYDAEAIKEPAVYSTAERRGGADPQHKPMPDALKNGIRPKVPPCSFARDVNESPPPGKQRQHRADRENVDYSLVRNRRDVWTVATQPFPEAHFATFPPALIEPCILAGCPKGGTVLDPFFGSGTTGLVCQKHYRRWVGIDLNPDYCDLAKRRLNGLIGRDKGAGDYIRRAQSAEGEGR